MTELPTGVFQDIVDDLDVAIFFTDQGGTLMYINEQASLLVRMSPSAARGRSIDSLLPSDVVGLLAEEGVEAIKSGRIRRIRKKPFKLPWRGMCFFDIRAIPYRRTIGGPWVAYLLLDITAQERRETASERARVNAEAEAVARQAFLARMSHEIRTPMNAIMGMTELALQSNPVGEMEEYLGYIKGAADTLLCIINDVLDFAKVESGRMELEELPINLKPYLAETIALLSPLAEEKGIDLRGEVADGVPQFINGDPTRIRQILMNLIGNAVKFTRAGSILVQLDVEQAPPDNNNENLILVGSVADTGIGIEPEKLQGLFEPFTQNDASVSREYGGTGLGLAICRSLTRLMGGDIEAESRPGHGSRFKFRIKVRPTKNAPESAVDPSDPKKTQQYQWNGERILLAEDNRVNRLVAENLLSKVGLSVSSCEDGHEAVKRWKDGDIDLILMDLEMPGMDGMEATRKIREAELSGKLITVPIIALTAHVLEEERLATREAGMNGWVGKPMRPPELYAELARLLPPVVSGE
jgi:signal transduction histidine kinase/CheY-like chemotaxis protein